LAIIEIQSLDQAFSVFNRAIAGEFDDVEIEGLSVGDWVNPAVHVDVGHSEITPPFMEAFVTSQDALYKLVALVKYGAADIRHLTNEDERQFQIQVKVTEGSSNFFEQIADAITKIGEAAVGKLSSGQIVALLAGTVIVMSGGAGWTNYLEHKKEIRIEEIASEERKAALDAVSYANKEQAATTRLVIEEMRQRGGPFEQAVESADESHAALLKAASTVSGVSVNGTHISQDEARELRKTPRRAAVQQIIEREMKVIDINTSDPAHTSIVVEGLGDRVQYKLQFRDRLIQERDLETLFNSLRSRGSVWLRLEVKMVGSDPRSVEILGVVPPPVSGTTQFASTD
jgi:hypothetical protein